MIITKKKKRSTKREGWNDERTVFVQIFLWWSDHSEAAVQRAHPCKLVYSTQQQQRRENFNTSETFRFVILGLRWDILFTLHFHSVKTNSTENKHHIHDVCPPSTWTHKYMKMSFNPWNVSVVKKSRHVSTECLQSQAFLLNWHLKGDGHLWQSCFRLLVKSFDW